jgi:proteic killer suppression protein
MIRSFRDEATADAFDGKVGKGFPVNILRIVRRKLEMVNAAAILSDLRSPPGNRLEALAGDRKGQHSIRVNDQYRICFIWTDEGPADVELTDYH